MQNKSYIDLSGQWNYALDPNDLGEQQQWFVDGLPTQFESLRLPGTLSEQGIGEEQSWDIEMNRETVRSLRQRYRYVGAAWYSSEIDIPQHFKSQQLELFLERVMTQSTVWINGQFVGKQDSLSVPHRFDISKYITFGGSNTVTIRVDNRDIHNLGQYPSAYTDETQTIWNGIVGRMHIQSAPLVKMEQVQLFPNIDTNGVTIKGYWVNHSLSGAEVSLSLAAKLIDSDDALIHAGHTYNYDLPANSTKPLEIDFDMGDSVQLWDEFNPNLYDMIFNLNIKLGQQQEAIHATLTRRFGMRSFVAKGKQLEINGRPAFLRGTLECCIFPHTGYPPTDLPAWVKLYSTIKQYGLNHIRFHSWCPPKAAFEAADLLGIYVQAEGPVWMDTWNTPVGAHAEHYQYLPQEARRIIDEYGNHPSFCIFSNGNELNGDFTLLHHIITDLKASDPRRLYTLTTNWDRPLDSADDLFCAQTVDGIGARGQYFPDELVSSTLVDFTEAVELRNVPLITHEVGQYTVYPDVEEIDQYTGVLRAVNLEVIRADLASKKLLGDIHKFVYGSGMLALQLYREEIEAALRTPQLGGFQLLDLHDFPGQSTATVGILNAFWESKGLIDPEKFRRFCSETVLLLKIPARTFKLGATLEASIEIAHFGPSTLPPAQVHWSIQDDGAQIIDSGVLHFGEIRFGAGIALGSFQSDALKKINASKRLHVVVEIREHGLINEWSIWAFQQMDEHNTTDTAQDEIIITDCWDERIEQWITDGGSALFVVNDTHEHVAPGKFYPVFWSPVHFATENPCGIAVNANHPIFNHFPTATYAEHHWQDLLDHSWTLCIDSLSHENNTIVQVIPNFYHNRRLTNLMECRIGKGKLIICGIDIVNELSSRMAASQLRYSIINYMKSDEFSPEQIVSVQEIRSLLLTKQEAKAAIAAFEQDIALGKRASSDSELSAEHRAAHGNDGHDDTMWLAEDNAAGHYWQVDLEQAADVIGTRVRFHCEGNFLYVIQASIDGHNWEVAVNQTGHTTQDQVRIDRFHKKARFIRMVYNKQPNGVRAGHISFEVFAYSQS